MATVELTSENFEQILADNDIVLIDFWASWCGPCKMFGPIYDKVAEKHPDIVFAKVNTEQEQDLAGALQIFSIPTLMVFRENIMLFNQAGMLPEHVLEQLVAQVLALDMEEVRAKIEQASQEQASQDQAAA